MRLDFGQPDFDDDDEDEPQPVQPLPSPPDLSGPPPPTAPAEVRAAEAARLVAWVEQMGGSAAGVSPVAAKLADGTSGVGLVATDSARRGDVLLSVPLSLGLSAESALRSSIGPYLSDFDPLLADYAFIALALIHERSLGTESQLAPWLSGCPALLPAAGFAELPLLWDSEGIAQLASATTAGATERVADVREDFEWLQANVFAQNPAVFPPNVFCYGAYMAAVATAFSRALPIAASGDQYDARPILLPLLDLANHDGARPTAAVGFAAAQKAGPFGGAAAPACATLVASANSLDKGTALCVRYGGTTAGEMLLDHGFLAEPVAPVAALPFEIDEDDRFLDEKYDVLDLVELDPEYPCLLTEEGEIPPAELLAFLRLKHIDAADAFLLEPVFIDVLWNEHLQLPVSEDNERRSLSDVGSRCDAVLAGFGGSLQEDLQTLAEADRASRAYALAAVRYAERRVLQSTSRAIEAKLGTLKGLEYYQQRRLNALGLQPVESEEELDALRAAGRQYSTDDIDW